MVRATVVDEILELRLLFPLPGRLETSPLRLKERRTTVPADATPQISENLMSQVGQDLTAVLMRGRRLHCH